MRLNKKQIRKLILKELKSTLEDGGYDQNFSPDVDNYTLDFDPDLAIKQDLPALKKEYLEGRGDSTPPAVGSVIRELFSLAYAACAHAKRLEAMGKAAADSYNRQQSKAR